MLRLIFLLALTILTACGCTATLTAQLEVDRPLAITIDDHGDGS